MKLPSLAEVKKALGALGTVEAGALALGYIDKPEAGYITAVLGAVTSVVVYLLDNTAPKQVFTSTGPGSTQVPAPQAA